MADLNFFFFLPKEAQLLFRQLQILSARNIAALKCESRKTKCWVPWNPPLMQLSVNMHYSIQYHVCWHRYVFALFLLLVWFYFCFYLFDCFFFFLFFLTVTFSLFQIYGYWVFSPLGSKFEKKVSD